MNGYISFCRGNLCKALVLCFLLSLCMLPKVLAAGGDAALPVWESKITEDAAILYVAHTDSPLVDAQIGTDRIPNAAAGGSFSVVTWILLDNSLSISAADRERAKKLMVDIISQKGENEKFNLCTFAEQLNPILYDCDNVQELELVINALEHHNQKTFLTDALMELTEQEQNRTEADYVRIIVISDGVDNNPGGHTRDELTKALSKSNIPVYSVGCAGNATELKEMYALSRQTGAKSWAFDTLSDFSAVTNCLNGEDMPTKVVLPIPETLRDGSTKGIRVSFEDGRSAAIEAAMPFAVIVETEGPSPTPALTERPATEPSAVIKKELPSEPTLADWFRDHWLPVVLIALVVMILIPVCIILEQRWDRKSKKTRNQPDREERGPAKKTGGPIMVVLTNQKNQKHYETRVSTDASGTAVVSIGRAEDNNLVLEDETVSGHHCRIIVRDCKLWICDLDSTNGTKVDQQQIGSEPAQISDNAKIQLGEGTFTILVK